MCFMDLAPAPTMSSDEEFFRQHVPIDLMRNIARAVVDTGKAAYLEAKKFQDAGLFLDADVANRRLLMEHALRTLILPPGFKCETHRTPSGSYAQIRSEQIVLTAVTRDEDVTRVEPYRYRETLARGCQRSLFDDLGIFDPKSMLYALLVYGGVHGRMMPSLAKITFPLPDGSLPCSINLLSEFPELFRAPDRDLDDEQVQPRLRTEEEEEDRKKGGR